MLYHRLRVALRPAHLMMGAVAVAFTITSAHPARADIKVGFQAPLTGFAATDGKSAKIAAEMAIDDINAAGGVLGQKLHLIT
jgi:branched-chain amino acid transport system substrate-binding protein